MWLPEVGIATCEISWHSTVHGMATLFSKPYEWTLRSFSCMHDTQVNYALSNSDCECENICCVRVEEKSIKQNSVVSGCYQYLCYLASWRNTRLLFFGYLHICHVLLNLYSKFSGKQMSSSASCLMIVPHISVIEIDYHAQQFSFMVICIACGYFHTQIDFYVNLCNKCMSTAFVCIVKGDS